MLIVVLVLIFLGILFLNKKSKMPNSAKPITFWSIQLKPIFEKEINEIISDFEKNNPNYKVVWVDIPIQEAQKRTLASVLSNNPPDIVNLNPDFSLILAQKNALEYFSNSDYEQYNKNLVEQLKYKNKVYALPFYATSSVVIYNRELYQKCSNDVFPKTFDELFLKAPELKSCTNISPIVLNINENDTLLKILNKYDVFSFKDEFEQAQTIKLYQLLDEMYKKEYFPKDILTINHQQVVEQYMSNPALSIIAGANFIKMIKQNAPDMYKKSQIAPQLTGENKKYDISLMNLIIPKKSKNKAAAKEFIKLLTNKENQLKLSKATNVLSANKYALKDDYFTNCENDLVEISRCQSAKQLDNILINKVDYKNKKDLNEILNKTLEEILLDKNSTDEQTTLKIDGLIPEIVETIEDN